MSSSLPETISVTIPVHGCEDTYNNFDALYPIELRNKLAALALDTAQNTKPDITEADVWASGFSGDYSEEGLGVADASKLERASTAHDLSIAPEENREDDFGFKGDDSNQYNIIERNIHEIRDQKLEITRRLARLSSLGQLTPSVQNEAAAELRELDSRIKDLQAVQEGSIMPVYYATPLEGVRDDRAEDNPLSYIGDVPGTGWLALYDGRAIASDPALVVSRKLDTQIRIAGKGLAIMRHALAVIRLDFVE